MPSPDLSIRSPRLTDGSQVADLIKKIGTLEPNTTYAYLLLCHHFQQSSLLLEHKNQLIGAALGYRNPQNPSALFLWQIGVLGDYRGRGYACFLLDSLIRKQSDLRFVEATISPLNHGSRRLFERVARLHRVSFQYQPLFEPHHFGSDEHEPEELIQLGPYERASLTSTTTTHSHPPSSATPPLPLTRG